MTASSITRSLPGDLKRGEFYDQCRFLDTEPDEAFDRITNLAARTLHYPIALISFMDSNRHWFKSRLGLDFQEIPRPVSMCSYCYLSEKLPIFIVEDTHQEEQFLSSPLVTGFPYIRFYAGASLFVDGVKVGVLCVIDNDPHFDFDLRKQNILIELAHCVTDLILIRRQEMLENRYNCIPLHQSALSIIREPLSIVAESKEHLLSILRHLSLATSCQRQAELLEALHIATHEFVDHIRYLETIVDAATHVMQQLLVHDLPSSFVTFYEKPEVHLFSVRTEEWWESIIAIFKFMKVWSVSLNMECHIRSERIVTHPELMLLISSTVVGHLISLSHEVTSASVKYLTYQELAESGVPMVDMETCLGEGMVVMELSYQSLPQRESYSNIFTKTNTQQHNSFDNNSNNISNCHYNIYHHNINNTRTEGFIRALQQLLQWSHGNLFHQAEPQRYIICLPAKLDQKRLRSESSYSEDNCTSVTARM